MECIISRITFHRFGSFARSIHTPSKTITLLIHRLDAICFDVDSTVCKEEGIDVLARYKGVGKAVKKLTNTAMDGHIKFEDALATRLQLIKPSLNDIQNCLNQYPPLLSDGIQELIKMLKEKHIGVYLISGGFRLMIEPVARQLEIPETNIFANTLHFDDKGAYRDFDSTEFTSADGGKAKAVAEIKKVYGHQVVAMVGDGMTDAQAVPPADLFIGYGGIVTRESVRDKADHFVTHFDELRRLLM